MGDGYADGCGSPDTMPADAAVRQKNRRVSARLSGEDFLTLMLTALAAGMSASEVIRRRLNGVPAHMPAGGQDGHEKAAPASDMSDAAVQQRIYRVTVRLPEEDFQTLTLTALTAEISVSAVIRNRLNGVPIFTRTDVVLGRELRRQMGLVKYLHMRGVNIGDIVGMVSATVGRIEKLLQSPERDLLHRIGVARNDDGFVTELRRRGADLKAQFTEAMPVYDAVKEIDGLIRRIEASIAATAPVVATCLDDGGMDGRID